MSDPRRLEVLDSKAQAKRLAALLRQRIRSGQAPYVDAWHGKTYPNGWTTLWVSDKEEA